MPILSQPEPTGLGSESQEVMPVSSILLLLYCTTGPSGPAGMSMDSMICAACTRLQEEDMVILAGHVQFVCLCVP